MTDSHGFQNPKSLRRSSLCGMRNVLRHTESTFNVFLRFHHSFNMVLWSPLSRCSIQKECARGLLARSWISMGEGPQQCPSMTLTPPEISVSADIKVKSASPHAACLLWNPKQTSVLCCSTYFTHVCGEKPPSDSSKVL